MKQSQAKRILSILQDGEWHCTSEFYALFIADPRRRVVDLKEKGYELENQKCSLHTFHDGGSKMWRLLTKVEYRTYVVKDRDGNIEREIKIAR